MNIENLKTRYEYDLKYKLREKTAAQFHYHQMQELYKEIWDAHKVFCYELEFEQGIRVTGYDCNKVELVVLELESILTEKGHTCLH